MIGRLFILLFILMNVPSGYSQIVHIDKMDTTLQEVKGISLQLKTLESFGLKKDHLPSLRTTLHWLKDQYKSYGYSDIYLDSFKYVGHIDTNINLVVNKHGTNINAPWIIVCSHYDTRTGPGVNDNGTGVVATLQIARIIQNIPTRYNVRFINFAGEEDGLIGSQHYVENTLSPDDSVRLILNMDQLGGTAGGNNNGVITCERDEESNPTTNNLKSWMITDTMAKIVETYTDLKTVIDRAYASDYMPFQLHGYVITGLYQFEGMNYPFYHQLGDSLSHVDTSSTLKVIKGALASVLHFAQSPGYLSVQDINRPQRISVYPNPNAGYVYLPDEINGNIRTELIDQAGVVVHSGEYTSGIKRIDLNVSNGYYTLIIHSLDSKTNYYTPLIVIR